MCSTHCQMEGDLSSNDRRKASRQQCLVMGMRWRIEVAQPLPHCECECATVLSLARVVAGARCTRYGKGATRCSTAPASAIVAVYDMEHSANAIRPEETQDQSRVDTKKP